MHTILVVLATLFVCGFLLPPIVACFVYLWLAAWLTWPLPLFFAALWVSLWGSAWPIVSLILLLVIVSLGLLLRLWFAPEPGTDGEHSSGNIGRPEPIERTDANAPLDLVDMASELGRVLEEGRKRQEEAERRWWRVILRWDFYGKT